MQEALESALAELVFGPELKPDDGVAVAAWLARHRISAEDERALREGELARLLVYRELVRGTLLEALQASIPRSLARLGTAFDVYFDRFLAERGPQTHYLRDVTTELLDFCEPLWRADPNVPDYLIDLARHEALHIEIAAAPPRAPSSADAALELDAALTFVEASRLVRYAYAVHRLPEAELDTTAPEHAETRLFVYRSPEHDVRYLELTPLAAEILERLMAGASLRAALLGATTSSGAPLDDALLSGSARLLADLSERGAIVGVAASPPGSAADG
jgi:hypothetical protein